MSYFYVDNFNQALKNSLLSLSENNIIYLDAYKLFDEIVENPAQYGIDNIVFPACSFELISTNCYGDDYHQNVNYLFGDRFHVGVVANLGIAKYFLSVFNAPIQVSSILTQMYGTNTARNLLIASQLKEVRLNKNVNKIIPILGVSGNTTGKSYFNYADKHAVNNNLNLGFIYNVSDKFSLGAVSTFEFGKYRPYKTFNYKYDQKNLSIFGQYLFDNNVWFNSQIGFSYLNASKINRTIVFNSKGRITEQGDKTHGVNESLALALGYDYIWHQNYILSPIIGYTYEHYKIKGYKEKSARSTSMNFSNFSKTNHFISMGIELNTRNYPINLFGQITYNKTFNKNPIKIKSSINSAINKFTREVDLIDHHWISSKLGLSTIVLKKYNLLIDVEYKKDKIKNNQINYSIGINRSL